MLDKPQLLHRNVIGWGWSSVIEHVVSMHEVLGSILSPQTKNIKFLYY